MTPTTREQLLEAVQELAQQYPHWRLGQLICNAAGWADVDVWDIEDEQLLEAIRKQQDYQRSATIATPPEGGHPTTPAGSG